MTTRIHSEIRKLALAYYRGWITRDRYLQIRQDYLQYITDGKVPAAIDPKLIARPRKKSPASTSRHSKQSSKTKWIILLLVLIVLLAIAYVVYLFMDDDTSSTTQLTTSQTSEKPSLTGTATTTDTTPITDEQYFINFLQKNFINKRTWDIDALNNIKMKWLGLSQEQQKTVRASQAFQDFSGALIERIVDERELDNVVPSDYEMSLMTVAKNMGMMNLIPER